MKKIKAKPPTLPRNTRIIYVPDAVTYYMICQHQVDEHERKQKAVAWAEGLKVFQSRFGRLEE